MDLEQYRQNHGLTYQQLADLLGVRQSKQAHAWALGTNWPLSERLQKILRKTKGEVTIEDMHARRMAFLQAESRAARVKSRPERRVA